MMTSIMMLEYLIRSNNVVVWMVLILSMWLKTNQTNINIIRYVMITTVRDYQLLLISYALYHVLPLS